MAVRQMHLLLFAGALCGGCDRATPIQSASDSETGTAVAPDTSEHEPDGTSATDAPRDKVTLKVATWKQAQQAISAHRGKVVVLDVWNTGCPPCLKEFPNLVALQKKNENDVACMSFNIDYYLEGDGPSDEQQQEVLDQLKQLDARIENLMSREPDEEIYKQVDFVSIPAVYVYDRNGKLSRLFFNDNNEYGEEGFTYRAHIVPLVEKLLAE